MKYNDSVDTRIDIILSLFKMESSYRIGTHEHILLSYGIDLSFYPDKLVFNQALNFLLEGKYIKEIKGNIYEATRKGILINETGGWLAHVNIEKHIETLKYEQIQSTINANKISVDTIQELREANGMQKLILYATILIALSNLGVSIFDHYKEESVYLLSKPTILPKRLEKLDITSLHPSGFDCVCSNDSTK
jgi:hypothetical protein